MESRHSEGVPFASLVSLTRHLADTGPSTVPKSGNVTITKIENLHIDTRRNVHGFQKCYSFLSYYFTSRSKVTHECKCKDNQK